MSVNQSRYASSPNIKKNGHRTDGFELLALLPISLVSPLFSLAILLLTKNDGRSLLRGLIFGFCLGVAFYGMRLDATNDIVRHMALLSNYSNIDLFECFGAGHYAFLPAWDFWCWTVAQTGDPYLLQSSAAFVGYTIIGYVAYDYSYRHSLSNAETIAVLLCMFCAVPILPLVAGIRSTMAVLFVGLAFYLHSEKGLNPLIAFAFMAIGAMIHPVAIFPIALALLVMLSPNRRPVVVCSACFIFMLFIAVVAEYVMQYIPTNNPVGVFLVGSVKSLLFYQEGSAWTYAHANSLNTRVNVLATIILMAIVLWFLIKAMKTDNWTGAKPYELCYFAILCAITSLALMIVLPVNGSRYLPTFFLLGIPIAIEMVGKMRAISRISVYAVPLLLILDSTALLALHAYSINYGLIDPSSFVSTVFLGVAGTML